MRGVRYAVYVSGIRPYHGAGSAEGRLTLESGWPFPLSAVAEMRAGLKKAGYFITNSSVGRRFRVDRCQPRPRSDSRRMK